MVARLKGALPRCLAIKGGRFRTKTNCGQLVATRRNNSQFVDRQFLYYSVCNILFFVIHLRQKTQKRVLGRSAGASSETASGLRSQVYKIHHQKCIRTKGGYNKLKISTIYKNDCCLFGLYGKK